MKDKRMHEELQITNAEVLSGNFETKDENCDGFYETVGGSNWTHDESKRLCQVVGYDFASWVDERK